MKILFTSPILEHPPAGGPQLRIENSIKALSALCELDIISRSAPSIAGDADTFYKQYCTEFHIAPFTQTLSSNRYIRKAQRILGALTKRDIKREAAFILDHIDRRGITIIWFGYGNISFPLIRHIKQQRPALKIICDTDSVWSRFVLRELPYAKGLRRLYVSWSGKRKEREEKAWVDACDITTAVSEVDANYYRSIAKDPSRIHIFSNVIDLATYANPPAAPADFKHPSIYLAGTFGHYHSPMDTAARWFIEGVLPLVRQEIPNVHFYIVGRESDRMFGHLNDPNITVTGKLPSVLPYLCNTDVALVPLKFESGTRFKILEAGACHVPLVSTTLGAEGIPVIDQQHLLIADTEQEFANAIIRLLRDPAYAKQLAKNCHDLVEQHYSVAWLKQEATSILETLKKATAS